MDKFLFIKETAKNLLCSVSFLRETKEKNSKKRFEVLNDYKRFYEVALKYHQIYENYSNIDEKVILEIGNGNSIVTALYMVAWGAKKVYLVDRFKHLFWDDKDKSLHNKIISIIKESAAPKKELLTDLFKTAANGKILLNNDYIEIIKADAKAIPLQAESFDLIVSNAVLERVHYPVQVVSELSRLSKKGGISIHEIDLRDHFVKNEPLRLLQYSNFAWNLMTWNRSGYTNRLRKSEWENIFSENGFDIAEHQEKLNLTEELKNKVFAEKFRKISDSDLKTLVILFVLKKRNL